MAESAPSPVTDRPGLPDDLTCAAPHAHVPSRRERLRRSDTARAGALAVAQLAANALALVFTVAFARLLGTGRYGSLAALLSALLILSVPGNALQVAAARETALGRLGENGALAATLARWAWRIALAGAGAAALALALRGPLARLINVREQLAAAAVVPTAFLWLILCIQRGALQGLGAYATVGWSIVAEQVGRLVGGLAGVAIGLGVAGAYLGTPLAFGAIALGLLVVLGRRLGPPPPQPARESLRDLARVSWVPMLALTLIAVLQNIDVIVVKHQLSDAAAGSYAAAAVAAKAIVWVAVGVGFYLVPEATRRAAAGQDPRAVLVRTLAVVAGLSLPALAIFALVPHVLLRLAFGARYTSASGALVVLGAGMTLLAITYLAVQYLLAMGHARFLVLLAAAAIADPLLLVFSQARTLEGFAWAVLAAQALGTVVTLAEALRAHRRTAGLTVQAPAT